MEDLTKHLSISFGCRAKEIPEFRTQGILNNAIFVTIPVIVISSRQRMTVGSDIIDVVWMEKAEMFTTKPSSKGRSEWRDFPLSIRIVKRRKYLTATHT